MDTITNQFEHKVLGSIAILEKKANEQIYQNGSYFLRNPKKGKEHSSVYHNHIDAKDHLLL